MKNISNSLLIVLGAFVLMACTCNHHHIYYSPPPQNVPMLREKMDANLNCGFGSGNIQNNDWLFPNEPQSSGYYAQASFSPVKFLGIACNYSSYKAQRFCKESSSGNPPTDTDLEGKGNGFMFDIAGGYYRTLDSLGKISEHLHLGRIGKFIVLESYFGLGISAQHHLYRDHSYTATADLNANYLYIQPAIGVNCNWLTLSVSARFNQFHFSRIYTNIPGGYPPSQYADEEIQFINYISSHRSQFFIEPCFTAKLGWKYIKLSLQYTLSHSLNGFRPNVFYEPDRITFGFSFSFASRYLRRNN